MRLLVTSDLHFDLRGRLTSRETIERMVDQMAERPCDAVALAGDIAHGLEAFEQCVAMFRRLQRPIYVLAGNHDLWRDDAREIGSEALWQRELQAATERAGGKWLEGLTARFGRVAMVGSLAWYDYSGMDPGTGRARGDAKLLKAQLNNDARRIDWEREDTTFAAELGEGLMQRIYALERDPSIDEIVVVTHVPVVEQQMHRKPNDLRWGIANAYFGNLTLGERVLAAKKLRVIVSGHTHWGMSALAARGFAPAVETHVVGSDYGIPNFVEVVRDV